MKTNRRSLFFHTLAGIFGIPCLTKNAWLAASSFVSKSLGRGHTVTAVYKYSGVGGAVESGQSGKLVRSEMRYDDKGRLVSMICDYAS